MRGFFKRIKSLFKKLKRQATDIIMSKRRSKGADDKAHSDKLKAQAEKNARIVYKAPKKSEQTKQWIRVFDNLTSNVNASADVLGSQMNVRLQLILPTSKSSGSAKKPLETSANKRKLRKKGTSDAGRDY